MRVAVLSAPGREELGARVLEQLSAQNPGFPYFVFRSSGDDPILDFWELLRAFRGDDLLALEDDIVTARNFFAYAGRWSSPFVTSFFHAGRRVIGMPVGALGHTFNQAIKIPAGILESLLEVQPMKRPGSAQDDSLGIALSAIGAPIVYHPSRVQHVGLASTIWGSAMTLEGRRAVDFPGLEFDCLAPL